MATHDTGPVFERLVRLEGVVRQQGDQLGEQGAAVDHILNTLDTIVLPTQAAQAAQIVGQQKVIDDHAKTTAEAHDYIVSQKGAWALVQRAGIVVAALASAVTLVMKIIEAHPK